jgi:hypothetical protein
MELKKVPIQSILADWTKNDRGDQETVTKQVKKDKEFVSSIESQGILQPLIVMENPDKKDKDHDYVLCNGFRRYVAVIDVITPAKTPGAGMVDVLVDPNGGESDRQYAFNLHEEWSPAAKGRAILRAYEDNPDMKKGEVVKKFGLSSAQANYYTRPLKDEDAVELIEAGANWATIVEALKAVKKLGFDNLKAMWDVAGFNNDSTPKNVTDWVKSEIKSQEIEDQDQEDNGPSGGPGFIAENADPDNLDAKMMEQEDAEEDGGFEDDDFADVYVGLEQALAKVKELASSEDLGMIAALSEFLLSLSLKPMDEESFMNALRPILGLEVEEKPDETSANSDEVEDDDDFDEVEDDDFGWEDEDEDE